MRPRVRSLLPLAKDMLLLLPAALVAVLGVWLAMFLTGVGKSDPTATDLTSHEASGEDGSC